MVGFQECDCSVGCSSLLAYVFGNENCLSRRCVSGLYYSKQIASAVNAFSPKRTVVVSGVSYNPVSSLTDGLSCIGKGISDTNTCHAYPRLLSFEVLDSPIIELVRRRSLLGFGLSRAKVKKRLDTLKLSPLRLWLEKRALVHM